MESHHRRSIRLRGYDYTQPGAYFVTIMAYNGDHLFGKVVDGVMELDALGEIVREEWFKTAVVRPYVRLYEDAFVVMPNHIHGIVWIVDTASSGDQQYNDPDAIKPTHDHVEETHTTNDPTRRGTAALCPYGVAPTGILDAEHATFPHGAPTGTRDAGHATFPHDTVRTPQFGKIVPHSLATIVRSFKSAVTKRIHALPYATDRPVWQRNYYERIIRNQRALDTIRRYIVNNPQRWHRDRNNHRCL